MTDLQQPEVVKQTEDIIVKENIPLEDRMRKYEATGYTDIPGNQPFIIRLDGEKFTKFTKGFDQPFDKNFINAMVDTTNYLVEKFNASTGYTHSDEISLVFGPAYSKNAEHVVQHIYNGRTSKLLSKIASHCSVYFNKVIAKHTDDIHYDHIRIKILSSMATFDARILLFPEDNIMEITNYFIWRHRDCYRNAVSSYGRQYYSHKQLQNKHSDEIISMITKAGCNWENVPIHIKRGIFGKKQQYEINNTTRSRMINLSCKVYFITETYNMLISKYLSDDFFQSYPVDLFDKCSIKKY